MKAYPDIIKSLPEINLPITGVEARIMQSKNNQLVFFDFKEDTEIPMHSHGSQWGIVVDGEIELTIAEETRIYSKGESYYIPSGVKHGGKIFKGFKAIDFFEEKDRY